MLDEIILRIMQGTLVSESLIGHYIPSRPPQERTAALNASIPAYVASLYDITIESNPADTSVNFFVIPKILTQLTLQEKIEFIDLFIEPLINGLPWVRTALGPSATLDITRPNLEFILENHQQQAQSQLSEMANYTNTVLALTMMMFISNQLQATTSTQLAEADISPQQLKTLREKLDLANTLCERFLTDIRNTWSNTVTILEPIHQVLVVISKAQLVPIDDVVIKSYFDQLHAVFFTLTGVPLLSYAFLDVRLTVFVKHYQGSQSLDDTMRIAIKSILNTVLLDSNKPLLMLWNLQSQNLIKFVRFILLATPDIAAKQLSMFIRGIAPDTEIAKGLPQSTFVFLCSCYLHYKHPEQIAVIRDRLIQLLSTPVQSEDQKISNYFTDEPSKAWFLTWLIDVYKTNDLKLIIAFCMSILPSKEFPINKQALLEQVTPDYQSQGIVAGWVLFSERFKFNKETWLIDTQLITIFRDLIRHDFFLVDTKTPIPGDSQDTSQAQIIDNTKLALYCRKLHSLTTEFALESALNVDRRSLELAQSKITQWNNLLHLTLDHVDHNQLIRFLSLSQRCDQTQFKTLLTIMVNSPYLSAYLKSLSAKEKKHALPELLITDESVSALLQSYLEKYKKFPNSQLFKIEQTPTAITNFLLTLLVLVSRQENTSLKVSQQTVWKTLLFTLLKEICDPSLINARACAINESLIEIAEAHNLSSFFPKEELEQVVKIIYSDEKEAQDALKREECLKALLTELKTEEEAGLKKATATKSKQAHKKKKTQGTTAQRKSSSSDSDVSGSQTLPLEFLPDEMFLSTIIKDTHDQKTTLDDVASPDDEENSATDILVSAHPMLEQAAHDPEKEKKEATSMPGLARAASELINIPRARSSQQQLIKRFQSLQKIMRRLLEDFDTLSELPQGFSVVISHVKTQLKLLNAALRHDELTDAATAEEPLPSVTTPTPYSHLDFANQHEIEQLWNQTLGQLCWDLSCEFKTNAPATDGNALSTMTPQVKHIVDELSHCYFKNLDLPSNMSPKLKHYLDHINKICLDNGFMVIIKGSYFTDPSIANDLDLLIIPTRDKPVTKAFIDSMMMTLERTIPRFLGDPTPYSDRDNTLYQHSITIDHALEFDLNFLLYPLALTESTELKKTADAILSFTAVHWHPDGHAVMLPKTARSICTERRALNFLGTIFAKTEQGYAASLNSLPPNVPGYLAKNIMKFDKKSVRLDPFLTWFQRCYTSRQ